jgi:hypothetical protein
MPTVPRYDQPQVSRRPLSPVSQPTDVPHGAGGLGFGIDTSGVDRALSTEYSQELERFNRAQIRGAAAKLAALETQVKYDPQKGILSMRGQNAPHARDVIDTDFAQGASEIEKTLNNDVQREAFRSLYEEHYASLHEFAGQHIQTELTKYEADQTQAIVESERNAAIATAAPGVSFEDVAKRASVSVAKQRAAINDFATTQGVAPEVRERMLNAASSATHAAIIQRMLNNDEDLTAQKYYDAVKDFLVGQDKSDVEKALELGSLRGESQRQADAILAASPDDQKAALAAANKITNPQIRDAVRARVEHEFQVQDDVRRTDQNRLYLQATNIIEPYVKAGRPFLASQIVPAGMWAQLPLDARAALERRAGDRENDARKWHSFLELTPQQLGKLNQQEFETQYWGFFDNQTRYRAESMWQAARDAERTGRLDPRTSSDLTFRNVVTIALGKIDPVYRKKTAAQLNDQQAQFYADFTLEAMRRKEEAEAAKGRPLTTTEVQQVVDRLSMERLYVDRTARGDPLRLPSEVSTDEQGNVYAPDVPAAERETIVQKLRAAGKPSTERMIQRLWGGYDLA